MVPELDISKLLKQSSFSGLRALYLCRKAYITKKPFIIADVLGVNAGYAHGYIGALTSIGLITFTQNKGMMSVVAVNDEILAKIEEIALSRAKETDEKQGYGWLDTLLQVDEYFK